MREIYLLLLADAATLRAVFRAFALRLRAAMPEALLILYAVCRAAIAAADAAIRLFTPPR